MEDPMVPSQMSLIKGQSDEENLETMRRDNLRELADLSPGSLQGRRIHDRFRLASKLLLESFQKIERELVEETADLKSTEDLRTTINSWENFLEPWEIFLKTLSDLEAVTADTVEELLNSLPSVIQMIFSHCRKSENLYGSKFNELRPQLTSLYRRTIVLLELLFAIFDTKVNFEERLDHRENLLKSVLEKIADIAVLTNGMDLKTLMTTWKVFAKLAAHHESLVKKRGFTESVTSRFGDIAKDIDTLLLGSSKGNDAKKERTIICVALLLKILGRLCMLYRGYCGNKVSIVLVQLLINVYRHSPPFQAGEFVPVDSRIVETVDKHIVPATDYLLNIVVDEKEFSKAFFQHGKSELREPIFFHLLSLGIVEELTKKRSADFSLWLQDDNIIDVIFSSTARCSEDFSIGELKLPVRNDTILGRIDNLGIYDTTIRPVCFLVSQTSARNFSIVERTLLKHLLSGEFWSSLLACDTWNYLARISSSELCHDHVTLLTRVQKELAITREDSLEFEMVGNLIGRLDKLLPDAVRESDFSEAGRIDDIVDSVCNGLGFIAARKNELSDASMDKLRLACLQLLDPGSRD